MDRQSGLDLSVVIPMKNEKEALAPLFAELLPVLRGTGLSFEVICVNDGSDDGTMNALLDIRSREPEVRVVDLSRNFGKEPATTAGLEFASGAAVVVMDADLQDPPGLIPELLAKWREGYEVIYAARRSRPGDGLLKRTAARLFYACFNRISDTPIPPDAGDFRLLDRRVVEALRNLPEQSRFMKGLFAWVGFRRIGVPYDRPGRGTGHSQWAPARLLAFALDGFFSFSSAPLRIWTYLGGTTAVLALLYALYLIVRTLVQGVDVPGYASTMVAILFFGGVQLLSIGILGEYIGRVFRETKRRPLFIVRETHGFDED